MQKLILDAVPSARRPEQLDPELRLRGDLHLDSIALMSVVFQFEEEFGISLMELELDFTGLVTVGDLLARGHELLEQAGAA